MDCPKELEGVLLQIVSLALVNIRGFSFNSPDLKRCGIEADHVHNLPNLIRDYSLSGLQYYLDVYVKEYVRLVGSDSGSVKLFEPLWSKLKDYNNSTSPSTG